MLTRCYAILLEGLQSISSSVATTLSGAYDTRNKAQKGADEASKGLMGMGKGE